MVKILLLSAFLFCNAAPAFSASEGYYGVKASTTDGTAEQRLAGLFCASVSSAVWSVCTVQMDGPNTRILIGNGVNVTTITATDLYIATVTASYIWLDGVDLEVWIDSIATSTGASAGIIAELSLSTAANKTIIDTLSTSTAANKTIIDTLSVSTDANKTIIDTLSVSTDANKTIIDTLSVSTDANKTIIDTLSVSTDANKTIIDTLSVSTDANTTNIATNASDITAIEVSTGVHAGLTGIDAHGLGAADMEWAGVHTWESSGTFKSSMTVAYLISADSVTTTGDITAGGYFKGDASKLNNFPAVSSSTVLSDGDGDTWVDTAGNELSFGTMDTQRMLITQAGIISFPSVEMHNSSFSAQIPFATITQTTFDECISGSTVTIITTGGSVMVSFSGSIRHGTLDNEMRLSFKQDNAFISPLSISTGIILYRATGANYATNGSFIYLIKTVAAGSHLYCLTASVSANQGIILGTAQQVESTFGVWEMK